MKHFLKNISSLRPSVRGYFRAAVLAGLSLPAAAQTVTQNTPFPLGVYLGNPHGNDAAAEQYFETNIDLFRTTLKGAHLTHFNTFVDSHLGPAAWVENMKWSAWSCNKSGSNYFGASTGLVPVVGVPLGSYVAGFGWGDVDEFYQDIIAGKYDDVFRGIVNAWVNEGYKTIQFRNGYEFNGKFMPWSPYNSGAPDVRKHFVQAFQRVADIEHEVGRQRGVTVQVSWNPAGMTWCAGDPQELYPGDKYVDIIGVDQYSPVYAQDLTDWAHASPGSYPQLASKEAFAADPQNRRHFWTWPAATQWKPEPNLGEWTWSVRLTAEFAKAHGKSIALDETGAGPSGSAVTPADDAEFPHWLSDELKRAQSRGVVVDHVNIWAGTESDGDWNFLNGSKPQEAVAWATYFGVSTNPLATSTPTAAATLSVYPNPAQDQLSISTNGALAGFVTLALHDGTGRVWRRHTQLAKAGPQTLSLDLRGLPTGLYLLRLQRPGEATQTQQVVLR